MNPPVPDPAVERYFDRLRAALQGMPHHEAEDIVLELRGHIAERLASGGDVAEALRSLGDPADLARQYRTESVAARAQCSSSPIVVLHGLLLLRHRSRAGWLALGLAAFGYAWALALLAAALEKILSPRDVGLWHRPGGFSLPLITVDGAGPAGTRELLGWWFVPLGLAAGALLLFATRRFALMWIRHTRAASRKLTSPS